MIYSILKSQIILRKYKWCFIKNNIWLENKINNKNLTFVFIVFITKYVINLIIRLSYNFSIPQRQS